MPRIISIMGAELGQRFVNTFLICSDQRLSENITNMQPGVKVFTQYSKLVSDNYQLYDINPF